MKFYVLDRKEVKIMGNEDYIKWSRINVDRIDFGYIPYIIIKRDMLDSGFNISTSFKITKFIEKNQVQPFFKTFIYDDSKKKIIYQTKCFNYEEAIEMHRNARHYLLKNFFPEDYEEMKDNNFSLFKN